MTNYRKETQRRLRQLLKVEIAVFKSFPRKDSFSALYIAEKINDIQGEMKSRNMKWKPFVANLHN